jgi:hypothetical protein
MIHFISGKPRGGKSLYGMRLLLNEIVHGDRYVMTNLAVKVGALSEYIQQKHPAAYARRTASGLSLTQQIFTLEDSDLAEFFCFRPEGRIKGVSNREWTAGIRPDFSIAKSSVLYILDEVHIAFNARRWAETGTQVLYYLSQHGKLGDDVVAITQHVKNVDRQFVSVAQDFTYVKNLAKSRMAYFQLPSMFVRHTYSSPPLNNFTPSEETGVFSLDVTGLASLYDTGKGVGIHGKADVGQRKRGIPWQVFAVGVPVLVWMAYLYIPNVLKSLLVPAQAKTAAVVNKASVEASGIIPLRSPAQTAQTNVPITCSGWIISGDGIEVFLSDGRTADSRAGEVQRVEKNRVRVFGEEFPVACSPTMRKADSGHPATIQTVSDERSEQESGNPKNLGRYTETRQQRRITSLNGLP